MITLPIELINKILSYNIHPIAEIFKNERIKAVKCYYCRKTLYDSRYWYDLPLFTMVTYLFGNGENYTQCDTCVQQGFFF